MKNNLTTFTQRRIHGLKSGEDSEAERRRRDRDSRHRRRRRDAVWGFAPFPDDYRGLGSVASSPSGVRGTASAADDFSAILA